MSYDYTEYLANFKKGYIANMDANGFLVKYRQAIYDEVEDYLEANQPLPRSIFDALPKSERRKMGRTIWHAGWQSGSDAAKSIRAIKRKYNALALADAEAERKAAGWTGHRHMTAPTGQKINRNGMTMGQYAGANDYEGGGSRTDSFTPEEIHNMLLGLDVRMTELVEQIEDLNEDLTGRIEVLETK